MLKTSKHTRGPHVIAGRNLTGLRITTPEVLKAEDEFIRDRTGNAHGRGRDLPKPDGVFAPDIAHIYSGDKALPNARLYAAATELYDVVHEFLVTVEVMFGPEVEEPGHRWHEPTMNARAVLAKLDVP